MATDYKVCDDYEKGNSLMLIQLIVKDNVMYIYIGFIYNSYILDFEKSTFQMVVVIC